MKGVSVLTKAEQKYIAYDIKVMKRMHKQNAIRVLQFDSRYKIKEGANMFTKERYKKELIRMWDSMRSARYAGCDACNGVNCGICPLGNACSKNAEAFGMIEAVEKWSKEHPVKVKKSEFFNSFDEVMSLFAFGKIDSSDLISIERWYYGSTTQRWKVTYRTVEE